MASLTEKDLMRLRQIYCTCDDGSLCCDYRVKGTTKDCEENCPGFYKMWAELQKLLEAS